VLDLRVSIHGTVVGNFSDPPSVSWTTQGFTFPAVTGPIYTIRLEVTRTVATWCGSVALSLGWSEWTLRGSGFCGRRPPPAVPSVRGLVGSPEDLPAAGSPRPGASSDPAGARKRGRIATRRNRPRRELRPIRPPAHRAVS